MNLFTFEFKQFEWKHLQLPTIRPANRPTVCVKRMLALMLLKKVLIMRLKKRGDKDVYKLKKLNVNMPYEDGIIYCALVHLVKPLFELILPLGSGYLQNELFKGYNSFFRR